jgi:hypothetical protein
MLHLLDSRREPLTPTLSPQERGEGATQRSKLGEGPAVRGKSDFAAAYPFTSCFSETF